MSKKQLTERLKRSQKNGRREFYLKNLHEDLLKDLGKAARTKQFRDNICSLNCIVEERPLPLEKENGDFYQIRVYSYRRSYKTEEHFQIIVSDQTLDRNVLEEGTELEVIGQFWNSQVDEVSKPVIIAAQCNVLQSGSVYAGMPRSSFIYLEGCISKPIVYDMFNGKETAVMLLEIHKAREGTDQILCIAWGENARAIRKLRVGDRVKVYGNVQNKSYITEVYQKWYVCIEYFIKIENAQPYFYHFV